MFELLGWIENIRSNDNEIRSYLGAKSFTVKSLKRRSRWVSRSSVKQFSSFSIHGQSVRVAIYQELTLTGLEDRVSMGNAKISLIESL